MSFSKREQTKNELPNIWSQVQWAMRNSRRIPGKLRIHKLWQQTWLIRRRGRGARMTPRTWCCTCWVECWPGGRTGYLCRSHRWSRTFWAVLLHMCIDSFLQCEANSAVGTLFVPFRRGRGQRWCECTGGGRVCRCWRGRVNRQRVQCDVGTSGRWWGWWWWCWRWQMDGHWTSYVAQRRECVCKRRCLNQ